MVEKIYHEMDERTSRDESEFNLNKQSEEKIKDVFIFKGRIPPLIKALHPKLKEDTFQIIRNDPSFLRKTALVCFECCLEIQKSKDDQICTFNVEEDDLVGIGRLRPEILNKRFYVRFLSAICNN